MKRKFQGGSGLMFAGVAKKKGIKAKQTKKSNQSSSKRKPRKSNKKKTKINKARILDIFSK